MKKSLLIFFSVGAVMILIAGLCSSIVLPNFIGGIQPGKQKRTRGDMKTLGTAIESYQMNNGHYPVASDMDGLCKVLVPDYIVNCIHKDGWWASYQQREFAYAAWGGAPAACGKAPSPACGPRHYGLASAGKDGRWEAADFSGYDLRDTKSFESDIAMIDGRFARQPVGRQTITNHLDPYRRPPVSPPDDYVPPQPP